MSKKLKKEIIKDNKLNPVDSLKKETPKPEEKKIVKPQEDTNNNSSTIDNEVKSNDETPNVE